jgi:hypothetical protein
MKHAPHQPQVVVYVNDRSFRQDGTIRPDICADYDPDAVRPSPAHSVVFDPARVHREFPERWRAYIRSSFGDLRAVCQAFGVCERTARKWWDGETGANGGHVAVAVRTHPEAAARMLFGRAA